MKVLCIVLHSEPTTGVYQGIMYCTHSEPTTGVYQSIMYCTAQ